MHPTGVAVVAAAGVDDDECGSVAVEDDLWVSHGPFERFAVESEDRGPTDAH